MVPGPIAKLAFTRWWQGQQLLLLGILEQGLCHVLA